MTTVNKSVDLRVLALNDSAQVGHTGYQTYELAGYTYSRNSVGGDLPSTFVTPIRTEIPVFRYTKVRVPGVYRVITGKRAYVYRTRDSIVRVPEFVRYKTIHVPPVKRDRKKPDHAYSTLVVEINDPSAYTEYVYNGITYFTKTISGNRGQWNNFWPVWNSNDDIALLSKLREKIAGSDFNAGVAFGEGLQSIRLIGDTATKILQSYQAARKGNFSRAMQIATGGRHIKLKNRVSSNLLLLRYGIQPLLQDVKSAAEFAAHHFNSPAQFVVRVSQGAGGMNPVKGVSTNAPTPYVVSSVDYVNRCSIKATISEKNVAQLIGVTDPLPVLWEVTPWSFVADWFIPIGAYLHARGLASAITGSFVTTRFEHRRCRGVKQSSHDNPGFYSNHVTMTRSLSTTLSVPLPSIKPLAKAATWQHAENAVALLISTFTDGNANRIKGR